MQLQFPNGHIFNMTAKISNHELDGVCIYQLFMLEMSREYFALHQIGNWNTTTLYPKPKRNWYILFNLLKDELQKYMWKLVLIQFPCLASSLTQVLVFLQSIEKGRKSTYTWMKHTFSDETQIYQVVYQVPTWIISFRLQLSVQLQEGEDMEKNKLTELIKQKRKNARQVNTLRTGQAAPSNLSLVFHVRPPHLHALITSCWFMVPEWQTLSELTGM